MSTSENEGESTGGAVAPHDWWRNMFESPEWGELHKQVDEKRTVAEVDRLIELLEIAPGASVLDVPCGVGRHATELAARGVAVTGVDVTPQLLDAARERGEKRGVSVDWVQGDMRDLPWREQFDAAFCYWGSFGYFDDEENARFIRSAADSLKPGGRFLVETHIAESLYPMYQPKGWIRYEGLYVIEDRRFDLERGRIVSDWTTITDSGGRSTHTVSIRIYTYRELAALFHDAGLDVTGAYNTSDGKPFAFGSPRLTMVGRKS